MGEFFKSLFEFIASGEVHILKRILALFLIFTAVYLIDGATGFTYYYNLKNRSEQLNSLSNIIKDTTNPIEARQMAQKELRILTIRKDHFLSFSRYDTTSSIIAKDNIATDSENKKDTPIWFYFLLALMSSWPFLYISIKALRELLLKKEPLKSKVITFLNHNIYHFIPVLGLSYLSIICHKYLSSSYIRSILYSNLLMIFFFIIVYSMYRYSVWAEKINKDQHQ